LILELKSYIRSCLAFYLNEDIIYCTRLSCRRSTSRWL